MDEQRDDIWWIDAWLNGELSEEEQNIFEERLNHEPGLLAKLEEQQQYQLALKVALRQEEKEALRQYLPDISLSPKKKLWNSWPLYAGVAAVFLTLIAFWLSNRNTQPDYVQIAQAALEPYPMVNPRALEEAPDSLRSLANEAYLNGRFEDAARYFQQLTRPDRIVIYFYLGNCQLQLGQYEAARKSFESALQSINLQEQTEWYIALSYLLEGNVDEALPSLRTIVQIKGHAKRKEAALILSKLE